MAIGMKPDHFTLLIKMLITTARRMGFFKLLSNDATAASIRKNTHVVCAGPITGGEINH